MIIVEENERIQVALGNLQEVVSRLQTLAESGQNIEDDIGNAVIQMSEYWAGEASTSFYNSIGTLNGNVRSLNNSIQARQTELSAAISKYEDIEAENTSAVDQLSTDDVF